jgi:cytochrome oxidase Cu insertion factor (SCO1/SenC/PrrC family)
MTVEKLKAVDRAYQASGTAVSIVVLALDPKNDTPDRLARFKRDHGLSDNWHFLWGSMNETRKLAKYLSVNPAYDDGHIDHDVEIAVFDAYGRLARSYGGWAFDPKDAVVR